MMFEADLGQEGALKLRRRVLMDDWTDDDGVKYRWRLRLVIDGMAGAVDLHLVLGNHRSEADPAFTPVNLESMQGGQTFALSWAPAGLVVHAFRPSPLDHEAAADAEPRCDVLGAGVCFPRTRDWPSLGESAELARRLGNPDGLEAVWHRLEEVYREEFVPALGKRALARAEADNAERFQEGAEFAGRHSGPPLVYVEEAVLVEKGVAKRKDGGLLMRGVSGMWVDPAYAAANDLEVSTGAGTAQAAAGREQQ